MFINESFISFIWQFQYFAKNELNISSQDQLAIIFPGTRNHDEGPDFLNATIKIGDVTWHGSVEIHIRSSHWNEHEHQKNPAYDNVILHVVWEYDQDIRRSDKTLIPTLELKGRVSPDLQFKFHHLVNNQNLIPCWPDSEKVDPIYWATMMDRVLVERIREKSEYALEVLSIADNDWEELSFRLLLRNFGFKINQHPMMALATYLPLRILKKHSDQILQLEALLFGTAGFLRAKKRDEYCRKLSVEFDYLKKKYELKSGFLSRYQWKFMRTHPANFPTVRLAQLAVFFNHQVNLFRFITEFKTIREIAKIFEYPVSGYWTNHYDFGKISAHKQTIGKSSINNIVINTFIPVLGAYGLYTNDMNYFQKAIDLLSQIPPEENKITRLWKEMKIKNKSASDSQAIIHLNNNYCNKKKCLNCTIGMKLLQADDLVLEH